mgnify:CR=1 FL=1
MRPQPSFFNRLLDARATASRYDVADYQQAIVRDLINLLNTICWAEQDWKLSQRSPLVRGSILGYGVPPIPEETTRDARTKVLAQTIERVIGQHEPRLRDVTVASSLSPAGAADSRLYFTISATLVVDWPVAGLNTGCVRSPSNVGATILPSIRWPMVEVTFLSWFMVISS